MDISQTVSVIWLCVLGLSVIAYVFWIMWRSDYDVWESALYLPTYIFGRLLWRVHFTNQPPAEIKSGALLVANHRSSVDPFFVQLAARRRVHWMVAREYCQHFLFGPILRAAQVIPTNRSGMDTAATKSAIRITKEGRLVGMFPEGRLNHTLQPLVSIRSGAALIAQRANVPIIPLYIKGSPYRRTVWSPLLMPGHVAITFGKPIFPGNVAPLPPTSEKSPAAPTGPEIADAGERALAEETAEANNGDQPVELDPDQNSADSLILQWGRQVVAMAGFQDFDVELASKRKRRERK
jgi:1-acyl-sn-glycerol-3-phosphate acyltransferase